MARSNTRDIPFSDILISKNKFLCNKKSYCTLVQNQWMKLRGMRVQYGFSLHRNCFLLINMLENFIKFKNDKIKKTKKNLKILNKISKFQKFLKISIFFLKFQIFIKFQKFHKISKKFKMIKFQKVSEISKFS